MKTNKTVDQFGLEGDGIVENFFHLLWTKDPMFGTIPSVYVPHTVIFRYNEPVTWFFMKDGALKKKIKKNLTKEHIKEVFLRYKYPSGIVAVFMRYKFEGNSEEPNVVFEYYSEKEFLEFINNKWQMSNGILQQFIQPKGDKNCIIQANWSHKLCFFEKIEALTRINDPKYDIYDKALTFEAENYHSREGPLRGYVLPNKIQRICANVAQHVQNVSMENIQIARMVLHFKVDANNRIWFLMCASLRINQGSDENKTKMKLKLQGEDIIMNHKPEDYLSKIKTPENIKTNIIKGKPVNMHKTYECINCKSLLEPDSVFETSYKTIIQGYEHDHLKDKDRYKVNSVIKAKPGNMEELLEKLNSPHHDIDDNKLADDKVTSLVPPLIKRIYPRLKDETYKILREDLSFLKKTALFCENCVLQIQQSQESNLTAQKESDKDFYGTGKLKPEGVKFRYAHTLEAIKQKTEHTKTGSNFMKRNPAMRSGTTTPEVQSARHFRSQSELPHIFAGIRAQKTLKIIDNETENLSVESSEQTDDKDTPSNRVEAPIRTINGNLIPAPNFKMVKFKKENLKQLNLNTNRDPSRLLSIMTPRKTMLEELAKKENALAAASGFTSAKTERVRTGSMQDIKGDVESQGLGEQTASTLAQTLTNYMPKMRFLQKEYQSVRSQSNNATLVRDSDTVERIFEMGNQKAKKELFEPFRRRK